MTLTSHDATTLTLSYWKQQTSPTPPNSAIYIASKSQYYRQRHRWQRTQRWCDWGYRSTRSSDLYAPPPARRNARPFRVQCHKCKRGRIWAIHHFKWQSGKNMFHDEGSNHPWFWWFLRLWYTYTRPKWTFSESNSWQFSLTTVIYVFIFYFGPILDHLSGIE